MKTPHRSRRPIHVIKELPQDIDAEKSFLGAVLKDNSVLGREILKDEDFHLQFHKQIYSTMLEMWEDRIGIDPATLADRLAKEGIDLGGGRREFLGDLEFIIPTAANAKWHAEILREKSFNRRTKFLVYHLERAIADSDIEKVLEIRRKIADIEPMSGNGILSNPLTPLEAFSAPEIVPVYILPGLRPETVGLIVGTGAVGKSFLTLEIGIAKTSGCDLTGIGIEAGSGGVLYLSAEDSRKILIERLQAIRDFIPPEAREKTGGLEIHDLYGRMSRPIVDRKGIVNRTLIDAIIRRGKGKDLIFLDTFRKFHDTNENDSGDMSVFLKVADAIALETGAAVVLLHHTSKFAGTNGKSGDKDAARGSSAIPDNSRWQLNLENKKIGTRSFVFGSISKANYGNGDLDFYLDRKEKGVLIASDPEEVRKVFEKYEKEFVQLEQGCKQKSKKKLVLSAPTTKEWSDRYDLGWDDAE